MTVDDAGRRAGAALRDRFDRLPAPPLAETQPRRPRSGRTAALAGIAVVLVVALLVTLVALGPDDGGPASPGGTWQRIDQRTAFGRSGFPTVITPWRGKLLALGNGRSSEPFAGPDPAAWTSEDGVHWERLSVTVPPSRFNGFSSVATRGRVIIATASVEDHVEFWRSTDGRDWRSVEMAVPTGPATMYTVSRRPGGFVAMSQSPTGYTIARASRDGRRWSGTAATRDLDFRTGLFPGAPLGRGFITFWGSQPGTESPLVYRSHDRIRWDRIAGAQTPDRLGFIAGDRGRARVLGIQFEPEGTFGGRIWSTIDGARWTEIPSFHEQMPVGNPDHLVQAGHWWVLGGNTGTPDGKRRASMWTSPDLRRWYEMPARLRGAKTQGIGMPVVAHDGRVIGKAGRWLWIWTPPE
jgi:hypothetical protein